MRTAAPNLVTDRKPLSSGQDGRAPWVVILSVATVAGIVVGALWFSGLRHSQAVPSGTPSQVQPTAGLSAATMTILGQLGSPVEIRFHALLDPNTVAPPMVAFAQRAESLLALFEQASHGKLRITRNVAPPSDAAAAALAKADGLKPFNLEKGDASYLGLMVLQEDRKETLASLLPDWEPALESDISRAIAHLNQPPPPQGSFSAPSLTTDAVQDLKRQLPNYASLSFEEGSRILRDSSVEEVKSTLQELGGRIQEAAGRLQAVESSGSEPERQALFAQLQKLRAVQNERLKQIAARASDRIETLRQLKAAAR